MHNRIRRIRLSTQAMMIYPISSGLPVRDGCTMHFKKNIIISDVQEFLQDFSFKLSFD